MAISRLCSVPDCGKAAYKREWCQSHYERWKRHGDPNLGRTPNGEALSYFETVVIPFDGDACLDWPYSVSVRFGYPRLWVDGKVARVNRLICERLIGEAPSAEHEAAHSCGTRRCVNPRHLRWATATENNADKLAHGTMNFGTKNGMAKCSATDIQEIRRLLATGKYLQRDIAAMFGIGQAHVSAIKNGQRRSVG